MRRSSRRWCGASAVHLGGRGVVLRHVSVSPRTGGASQAVTLLPPPSCGGRMGWGGGGVGGSSHACCPESRAQCLSPTWWLTVGSSPAIIPPPGRAGIMNQTEEVSLCDTSTRPSNTVAVTRPNRERRDSLDLPFLRLALAIYAENDRNGGDDPLKGREKVPVPADKGN
jgi:hypothetical protein